MDDCSFTRNWESLAQEQVTALSHCKALYDEKHFPEAQKVSQRVIEAVQWSFQMHERQSFMIQALSLSFSAEMALKRHSEAHSSLLRLQQEFPSAQQTKEASVMFGNQGKQRSLPSDAKMIVRRTDFTDSTQVSQETQDEPSSIHLVSSLWIHQLHEPAPHSKPLGPILNTDLLESVDQSRFLYDGNQGNCGENLYLKPNLVEGLHYITVSPGKFNAWKEEFGCVYDIPRPVSSRDGRTITEVYYQQIFVFGCFNTSRIVQISRVKTLTDLQNKVSQRLETKEFRLWKVSLTRVSEDFLAVVSNSAIQVHLPGAILLDLQPTEQVGNLSFGQAGNVLLVEKPKNDRFYVTERLENLERLCSNCLREAKLIFGCTKCGKPLFCSQECKRAAGREHEQFCEPRSSCLFTLFQKLSPRRKTWFPSHRGLLNEGSTCYMNSILQSLSAYSDLSLNFHRSLKASLTAKPEVASLFGTVLRNLTETKSGCVSAKRLKRELAKEYVQFRSSSQQDAHELLVCLISALHDALKRDPLPLSLSDDMSESRKHWLAFLSHNISDIASSFYGQLESSVRCPDCRLTVFTYQEFSVLSVPLKSALPVRLHFWYLRPMKEPVVFETYVNLEITVDQIKESINTRQQVRFGILKEFELEVLKDEAVLQDFYNNGQIQLLAYAVPKDTDPNMYVTVYQSIDTNVKERIKLPRLIFLSKDSSLKSIHLSVYEHFLPYFTDEEVHLMRPNNSYRRYGMHAYQLTLHNEEMAEVCGVCQQPNCRSCDLPFTDEPWTVVLRRIKVKYSITLIWSRKHSSIVNMGKIDTATLESAHSVGSPLTLHKCLDAFLEEEELDRQNQWTCPKCKQAVAATAAMRIVRVPRYLIVHLKRFTMESSNIMKLINPVQYPLRGLEIASEDGVKSYDLCGVVCHMGNQLESGHYIALCKFGEEWFCMNDRNVRTIREESVQTPDAYILFYSQTND